jgi:hypothetical protein
LEFAASFNDDTLVHYSTDLGKEDGQTLVETIYYLEKWKPVLRETSKGISKEMMTFVKRLPDKEKITLWENHCATYQKYNYQTVTSLRGRNPLVFWSFNEQILEWKIINVKG